MDQVQRWQATAETVQQRLECALQFDPGMARMGFSDTEAALIAKLPALSRLLNVQLIISHDARHPDGRGQARPLPGGSASGWALNCAFVRAAREQGHMPA